MGTRLLLILCGLAGGGALGVSVIALYSVLDFPSKLRQVSSRKHFDRGLESAVLWGSITSSACYLLRLSFPLGNLFLIAAGLFFGAFVGMLSASLTDIIGLVPVIMNKRKESVRLSYLLSAILLGKTLGALCYFLTIGMMK